jgi:hypothetical protein
MITQQYLDEVDVKLGQFCAAGYAYGLIGEANIRYMIESFPDLVQRQRVYRLGDIAALRHGDAEGYDDAQVAQLQQIEVELEGLEDYPLLDDDTFNTVFVEEQELVVKEIAEEHDVTVDAVWNAVYEVNAEFEWEQDYALLNKWDLDAVLEVLGVK